MLVIRFSTIASNVFFLICGDCVNVARTGGNPWPTRDRNPFVKDISYMEPKQPPLIRCKSDFSQSRRMKDRSRLASILRELENLDPLFDDYTNLSGEEDISEEDIASSSLPVWRTIKSAPAVTRRPYTTRHVPISKYELQKYGHLGRNEKKAPEVEALNSDHNRWNSGFGSSRKKAATSPSSPRKSSSFLYQQHIPKVLKPTHTIENKKENAFAIRNLNSNLSRSSMGKSHQHYKTPTYWNLNSSTDGSEGSDFTKLLNETDEWLSNSEKDFLPKDKARISNIKQKTEFRAKLVEGEDLRNADFQSTASSLIKLGAIKCHKDRLSVQRPLRLEHVSVSSNDYQNIFDNENNLSILSPSCYVLETMENREYDNSTTAVVIGREFAVSAESSPSPEPPQKVEPDYPILKPLSPFEHPITFEKRKSGIFESPTNSSMKLSLSLGNVQESKEQLDVRISDLDIKSSDGNTFGEDEENIKLVDEVASQKSSKHFNVKSSSQKMYPSEVGKTGTCLAGVGDARNTHSVEALNESFSESHEDYRPLPKYSPSQNEPSLWSIEESNMASGNIKEEGDNNIQNSSLPSIQDSSELLVTLQEEEVNAKEAPKRKCDRGTEQARTRFKKGGFDSCDNEIKHNYETSDSQSVEKNNINIAETKKPPEEELSIIGKDTSMRTVASEREVNSKSHLEVSDCKNNNGSNRKLSPAQNFVSSMSIHRNALAKEDDKPSETLSLSSLNAPHSPIVRVNKSVSMPNASLKDVSTSEDEKNKSAKLVQTSSVPIVSTDNSDETLLVPEKESTFLWRKLGRFRSTSDSKKKPLKSSQRSINGKSPRSGVKLWRKSGRKSSSDKECTARLKPGSEVKVTGINSGNNEQVGSVLHYIPEKKRYLVQFKDFQKSLKRENLLLVEKASMKKVGSSPSKNTLSQERGITMNRSQRTTIERRFGPGSESPTHQSLSRSLHPDPVTGPVGIHPRQKLWNPITIVARGKISGYNIPKKRGVQIHV